MTNKPGAKSSEYWLIVAVVLFAVVLAICGWRGAEIFKAVAGPGAAAALYAAGRTVLKLALQWAEGKAMDAKTISDLVANPAAAEQWIDSTIENFARTKVKAFAALEPEVDHVVESVVALAKKAVVKYGLAFAAAKLPNEAEAIKRIATALGVTL